MEFLAVVIPSPLELAEIVATILGRRPKQICRWREPPAWMKTEPRTTNEPQGSEGGTCRRCVGLRPCGNSNTFNPVAYATGKDMPASGLKTLLLFQWSPMGWVRQTYGPLA